MNRYAIGAASLVAAVAGMAGIARGDGTKEQCIDANAKAQSFRREGKFFDARQQLAVCLDSRCPRMVRDDCTQRLDELDSAQPTVVFDVKDAAGADIVTVRVTMDGRPFAEKLEGAAIAAEPGEHVFAFDVPGQPEVTRPLVLKEGEKGRRERVVVGVALAPAAPHAPVSVPAAQAPEHSPTATSSETSGVAGGGRKVVGLVLAGAGILGVGVGGVLGLLANDAWNQSKEQCSASSCPSAQRSAAVSNHDAAVTDGTAATVGFVAGGALLAAGAWFYFSGQSASASVGPAGARLVVAPSIGPGGAGLTLRGEM